MTQSDFGIGAARVTAPAQSADSVSISPGQLAAWSLVSVVTNMMMIPLNALIPAFYVKNTAVTLSALGLILLVARLYDAVVDPTIGYLSDRTQSRLGRRKPWILAGGLLASGASWLLFNPAPTAGWAYLLPVILCFYTAYSMMAVPHTAWGAELSRSHRERSLISGVLTFGGVTGFFIFMGIPILLSSPLAPLFKTAEITPPMLKLLGYVMVAAIPLGVLAAAAFAPQSRITKAAATGVIDCLKAIRANSAFRIFLGAYSLTGLGYGVYYATAYLFLDGYLGIPDKFPLIATITAVSQLVAIPILTGLSRRIERHRMWAIGIGVYGLLLPLRLLIPVGEHGLPFLIGLVIIENFANAASQVPQMAMLADCVDFGALRSRSNMAGSYYAVQQFILKGALAAGGAVAFFALGALHYEAKAKVHSASSLMGLGLVHTLGPLVLFGCAALLLWAFPLNRRRQGVVRRRLDSRLAPAD